MITYSHFIISLIVILGVINILRMTFFMIGSDIYKVKHTVNKRKKAVAFADLPTFSVIIPAHNEEDTIFRAVQSVAIARYPKNKLEIIVVDDGSTDETLNIAKQCQSQYRTNFKFVSQKNAGKAHALNNGIKNYATGELIMCLDADSSLDSNALINAADYFMDEKVVALSANVKIRPTKTILNTIQMFEYLVCYQMKRAQTIFNIEYIIGGIGSVFRGSALAKVGYYDTDTITEDIDLTMKFIQLGNKEHRVIYGADVIAFTESVLSLAGLIKQRFRWKYGRAQTFIKNRKLFFSTDKKNSKLLTFFYLPYAIFSDVAFFFEPFMISYIGYIIIRYSDLRTLVSAMVVVGGYTAMNVLAEDTIPAKQKLFLALTAPLMYFFFYILSFVEYVALIKTYIKFWEIPKSIKANSCGWVHVERSSV
jgi:biofilm PGA synthesis N-glycosyltransferase PgaC